MNTSRIIKQLFSLTILIAANFKSSAQELSNDESELYTLVMKYRKAKGLPEIPLSKSLTIVAQTHAKDLENNYSPESKM